jgi:hypothetical protein
MTRLFQHTPVVAPVLAQPQIAYVCQWWQQLNQPQFRAISIANLGSVAAWSSFTPALTVVPSLSWLVQLPGPTRPVPTPVQQGIIAWSGFTPASTVVTPLSWLAQLPTIPMRGLSPVTSLVAWGNFIPIPLLPTFDFIGMPGYPDWIGGPR